MTTAHPVRVCTTFASALDTALDLHTRVARMIPHFPETQIFRVRKRRGRWVVYSPTGRIMP